MPCNPSIGGTAKGHLVRGGGRAGRRDGLAIDDTLLQSRMLNTAKGPAVHSLRAQADKRAISGGCAGRWTRRKTSPSGRRRFAALRRSTAG